MTLVKGFRKNIGCTLGYDDKNDGFLRSLFSASKNNHSTNTKHGKVVRIKPDWKIFLL